MLLPTLYKRTSTGAVQVWRREIEGSKYRSISGQKDGAQVTSFWTQALAKNVGRSNEVSAEEQALLECDSAYKKKLAQGGYHESEATIDEAKYFKPMLAKNYDDRPVTNFDMVYSQPKLDGVRCIATADGLWTRQGKPIDACPHISDALAVFFSENPDAILDGELYADKLSEDFNKIISLVRKKNPSAERLAEAAETIQYHIYDYPSVDGKFSARVAQLVLMELHHSHDAIKFVTTTLVENQEKLDLLNTAYIEQGYEGQMVRLNGPYKNGRSSDLLKRKTFLDSEFEIVSINEGIGNRAGMAGFITYKLDDGREFGSGIRGNFDYYRELLENADKYVGGQGTVRYFNLTPDGVPRFPVTVALYEGERDI